MLYPCLSIAGSDSGGGAGIQADLRTFEALGCYGTTVITSLTAQNTLGIQGVSPVEAEFVALQIKAVLEDFNILAIKIGMLCNASIVLSVKDTLQNLAKNMFILLDPVLVSSSGTPLLNSFGIKSIIQHLFPLIDLLTPNLNEVSALTGKYLKTKSDIEFVAQDLLKTGIKSVLIKGGHLLGETCDDYFFDGRTGHWFTSKKIKTQNTHGTGCTLSAAITAYVAQGYSLLESIQKAKQYLTKVLQNNSSLQIAHGKGAVFK